MNAVAPETPPAEVYDQKFVPALFRQWGPIVAGIAGVEDGMRVLDVGCGTGALTVAVADLVGAAGAVAGLDANPEMLAVAQSKPQDIAWRQGAAEELPYDDDSFDAVVSQFAFMFFEDRPKALTEMLRVARPGATIAVAVCDDVERSPGYAAFAALLDQLFGREIGDAFRAPFVLGDPERLKSIARRAGLDAKVERRHGLVRFTSIEELVSTERACAWTLGGILNGRQFEELQHASQSALAPFTDQTGAIAFDMPSLILTFTKPG